MRSLLVLVLFAGSALADARPTPAPAPANKAPAAKSATKREDCKRVVVGKKVVCEVSKEITVNAGAPKPNVVIIQRGGKNVTGRPKSEDRLKGLSPRL